MSDVFWTAFFIFAGTCVTLIATWIQTRTVQAQTAVVIQKSDVIHNLVNSKMSAALQEIDRLKGVVEALQRGEAHP